MAGTIVETGSGADSSFRVGDRVAGLSNLWAPTPDQGGLQQYAILQADSVARLPTGFSDAEFVTLPLNMATIIVALFTDLGFAFPAPWEKENFRSSDFAAHPLVVLGAGTNIAKLTIRLAIKVLGIRNIIAVAGPSNESDLLAAGATTVVNRHVSENEITSQIHTAAGGSENITQILDCASWEHHLAAEILTSDKASRLVTFHNVNEAEVQKVRPLCRATVARCSNVNMGPHAKPFWETLPRWVEGGVVAPSPFKVLEGLDKVDEINKWLDGYAAGKGGPQLVVKP